MFFSIADYECKIKISKFKMTNVFVKKSLNLHKNEIVLVFSVADYESK